VSSWVQLVVVSVPLGGMQVVNRLYSRLDSVLLSLLRSPVDVAEHNIAFNFTDVLSNLPAFVMASVLPSLVHSTGDKLKQKLQLVLDAVVWFAAPIAVGGFVLRTQIVGLVAGPGYQAAAAPMAILILSVVVSFPQVVFVWGCLAINEYRLLLPAIVLTTAANLGLNLLLIPRYGPSGAAGAQLATECLSLTLTYGVFARKSRLRFKLGSITRAIGAAAVMVPAGLWLRGAWDTRLPLLDPFVGTVVLSAVYLGSSLLLGAVPSAVLFQLGRLPAGQRVVRTNGAALRACRVTGRRVADALATRAGPRRPGRHWPNQRKEPKR
jgi:O-antigen/teichoic acid export membrane protein